MKINWGTKLVIFALLFMSFIVFLVIRIMQTDVPMVDDNYYEKGLSYQKQIDNSKQVDSMVVFNVYNDEEAYQHLVVLNVSSTDIVGGKLLFYRPSDANKDTMVLTDIPSKKVYDFPIRGLEKGKWNIKYTWTMYGQEYTIEKPIER